LSERREGVQKPEYIKDLGRSCLAAGLAPAIGMTWRLPARQESVVICQPDRFDSYLIRSVSLQKH